MWNSGRLPIISASVSPRPRPSWASPPASASTRSRRAPQVIVNSSPRVRIATSSLRSAEVSLNASAIVLAPVAARFPPAFGVTAASISLLLPLATSPPQGPTRPDHRPRGRPAARLGKDAYGRAGLLVAL